MITDAVLGLVFDFLELFLGAIFSAVEWIVGAVYAGLEFVVVGIYWLAEAVLGAFFGLAAGIMELAPDIAAPDISGMVGGLSTFWEYFGWANNFVPLDQLVVIIGLVVTFYVALLVVRLSIWLLVKAHVLGGD